MVYGGASTRRLNVILTALLLLAAVLVFAGCSGSGSDEPSASQKVPAKKKPVVYTVNYPLQYIAERIGGNMIDVECLVPPDVDPAFWSPDAPAVSAYQSADLILLNGATYAKWVERVSLPPSKLVNTSHAFRDRYLAIDEATTHSQGPTGEHAHTGTAFTTWIDFSQAAQQAESVKDAFVTSKLGDAAEFERNYESLRDDLIALDLEIESIAESHSDIPLVASHPVYDYFARRYNLNLRSVQWEPDVFPDNRMWRELERLLESHRASRMIWEGEPLPETRERLQQMGIRCVVFDPCGNRPDEGNFATVMERNVAGLRSVFEASR